MNHNDDDWIKEIDKKIIHYLWTILLSILTAIVTAKIMLG